MLFNSSEFAIFFPMVTAAFFLLPHRFRWPFLLAASYYFYMCWKPGYIVLILITTGVDYATGLLIGGAGTQRARRRYLVASLTTNLALLGFFKYYGFFNDILRDTLAMAGIDLGLPPSPFLLPVGISFYTFQSLSYIFEVYRGRQVPERHFGRFALYVAFYPQLVAGPIERPQNLLPQFSRVHAFDYDRVTNGLKMMAWGMFKKVVVADRLAQFVDEIYAAPAEHGGHALSIATVFFAFQIFCDFSGYSDIAVGAANVMGFDLMKNFRRPYFASSVADFWRRWHISLSSWFRDYVYIPLGGSRVGRTRWCANILIVFLASGLWHGADWKFVAWGALHGLYIVSGRILQPARNRIASLTGLNRMPMLKQAFSMLFTFCLVCYAWIFFRANSMSDALYISSHLFSGWSQGADIFSQPDFTLSISLIALLLFGQMISSHEDIFVRLSRRPILIRWAAYAALIWCIVILGVFRHKEFIYFTF